MKKSLIWAMDKNRLIGSNNQLPWKLPADMKWFRQHTLGKPIVMGRKTFQSFGGKPLPQRKNIVLTQDTSFQAEGACVVHTLADAILEAGTVDEVMIIGGASLYQQLLPDADRLYITEVQGEFEGDTWFPVYDTDAWTLIHSSRHSADDKNSHDCVFNIYEKA